MHKKKEEEEEGKKKKKKHLSRRGKKTHGLVTERSNILNNWNRKCLEWTKEWLRITVILQDSSGEQIRERKNMS